MKFIYALSLVLFSTSLLAQDFGYNYDLYDQDYRQFLYYGDNVYTKNMKGLSMIMEDLQELDPVLFQKLQPYYKKLKDKKATGTALGIVGLTLGTTLMLTSFDQGSFEPTFSSGYSFASANVDNGLQGGQLVAGCLLFLGGTIAALAIRPKEADMLGFINRFNRHTRGNYLEIGLDMQNSPDGLAPGLGLNWRF